jgi:hypothetical protein
MYLFDDRFSTAVAFIEGFNAALDGRPLGGFQDWVCNQVLGKSSSLHWSYVVASILVPEILQGNLRIDQIQTEFDLALIDESLRLLEQFSSSSAG